MKQTRSGIFMKTWWVDDHSPLSFDLDISNKFVFMFLKVQDEVERGCFIIDKRTNDVHDGPSKAFLGQSKADLVVPLKIGADLCN
jgi:hypothetical protein